MMEFPNSPIFIYFYKYNKCFNDFEVVFNSFNLNNLCLLKSKKNISKKYTSRENYCTHEDIISIIQYYKKQLKKYLNDILTLNKETEKKLKKMRRKEISGSFTRRIKQ